MITKTSTLAFLVALSFDFTNGLPNPSPAETATTVSSAPLVPRAAGSPYPSSPTTNEFTYVNFDESMDNDKGDRTAVHDAFEDWAAVVKAAITSLGNTDDNTYLTWFPDTVTGNKNTARDFLKGVLTTLLDDTTDPPAPLPYVASFVCDHKDYGGADGQGICDASTTSYFSRLPGTFHVCPFGLSQTIKATDIKCDGLGDTVSANMHSLTGTLVHEFMHSQDAGDATPNGKRVSIIVRSSSITANSQPRQNHRCLVWRQQLHAARERRHVSKGLHQCR